MKKRLFLICALALVCSFLFCISTALAGGHNVTLKVDFEKNMIFSKYDVDVFIDDEKIGTYEHGVNFTASFSAGDGDHTIWFYEHGDKSNKGSIAVTVNSETAVSCKIECKNNKVKVTKVEIDRAQVSDTSRSMPEQQEEAPPAADTEKRNPDEDDVGKTLIAKDGVSVTLVGYRESKGDSFMEAEAGKTYVLVEFLIENNSSEKVNMSSLMCFDAYCDGFTTEYSFGAAMVAEGTLDGEVAAGKKMKGEIGYEVDKNWKELEIQVQLDVWSSEKLIYVIHKK